MFQQLNHGSCGPSDAFSTAIICHVFYAEMWPEILSYINRKPLQAHVIITVSADDSDLFERVRADFPEAKILRTANIGRDISPFIQALKEAEGLGCDIVCKIHSKKGATEPDTWRHLMFQSLLGSRARVGAIMNAFAVNPKLGMVGPAEFYLDGPMFIGPNRPHLDMLSKKLLTKVEFERAQRLGWGFFAGSMFWCRTDLFKSLIDRPPNFDAEDGADDGRVAHAIERFAGLVLSAKSAMVGLTDTGADNDEVAINEAALNTFKIELAHHLPRRRRGLDLQLGSDFGAHVRRDLSENFSAPGVNFIGPVDSMHGLGVSARGFADALVKTGLPLNVKCWELGFERVVKKEVDYPITVTQPINIIHLNLDLLTQAKLLECSPLREIMSNGQYNIAIIYWELAAVPPSWLATVSRFDEVWTASSFSARALRAVTRTPIRVVRPSIAAAPSPTFNRDELGLPNNRFLFLYSADLGSTLARKNPVGFWSAYANEFCEFDGAAAVLKLHYAHPADPALDQMRAISGVRSDMILLTGEYSDDKINSLMHAVDAYVSPHRSEGLGLTILEAMQREKPIISTQYGGVEDFIDGSTAFVIEHSLREVGEDATPYPPKFIWAEPKMASMRVCMRTTFESPTEVFQRTVAAKQRVEAMFGLNAASECILSEIKRIWKG